MKATVLKETRQYSGFMKLDTLMLEIETFSGGTMSMQRELVRRDSAVASVIHDPNTDQFLLVEQFRPGALKSENPWLLELVAGMLENDANVESALRREAKEEAALELISVKPMCDYLPTPGGSDEYMYLYYATADLSNAGGVHGLKSEHEDIRSVIIDRAELIRLLDQGKLGNSMTLIGVLWFLRHENELRA